MEQAKLHIAKRNNERNKGVHPLFCMDLGVKIRCLLINGEPWFIAKDVCDALGLTNSRKAVARLDDDEKGVTTSDTLGGPQQMNIVNEFGLYRLILESRKPPRPISRSR